MYVIVAIFHFDLGGRGERKFYIISTHPVDWYAFDGDSQMVYHCIWFSYYIISSIITVTMELPTSLEMS